MIPIRGLRAPVVEQPRSPEPVKRYMFRPQQVFWSEEMSRKLAELWTAGVPTGEIARQLGVASKDAVCGKAHRMGLSRRPSPIPGAA